MADRPILAVGPARGGVAHVFGHVVEELRARGVAVEAHALGNDPVGAREGWRAFLAVRRRLRSARAVHIELGSNDLAVFWFLVFAVLVRRDLVVVAHDVSLKLARAPGAALAGDGSRTRLRLGHRVLSPMLDRSLIGLVRRRVARWLVLGDEAARAWGPQVRGAVDLLPHGADRPTPGAVAPSDGRYVLYAGYMSPDKGVDLLLDAWADVGPATDLELVLAGTAAGPVHGPFVEELRARGEQQRNVPRWIEHPPEGEFSQLFAGAALVVLPYRSSSAASGILVRAMVEGRCVLATDVPAVRGTVAPSVSGVVVGAGDGPALTAALRALLADDRGRDALGAAAAGHAAQHFTWGAQVDVLERLYGR